MAADGPIDQQSKDIKESISQLTAKLEELKKASDAIETAKINLDNKRFDLEKEKHAAEIEKLSLERRKHQVELWAAQHDFREKNELDKSPELKFFVKNATPLSILVPLIVALATLAYGAYSAYQLAQSNFELKVAELVMNSNSPEQAKAKADSLATMFPDRLTAVALTSYNPTQFSEPSPERRKQLFDLIQAHPERKAQTVKLWLEVFPEDAKWVTKISIDPTNTTTPVPQNHADVVTPTPVSQTVQSTPTPTPVPAPTCEVVFSPGSGGSGRSWIGSWAELAQFLRDNPQLLDELMRAQDKGFLDFLNELSESQSVVNQVNEYANGEIPGDGILQGTSESPIIQEPLNP